MTNQATGQEAPEKTQENEEKDQARDEQDGGAGDGETGDGGAMPNDLEHPGIEDMSFPERAAHLAGVLAYYPVHNTGGMAELRRLNPEDPDSAAFWRLMNRYRLGATPEYEIKWATILQGIAIMTPNDNTEKRVRSVHAHWISLGESLFNAGDRERTAPICRDARVYQLLNARGPAFRRHLIAILRHLAQHEVRMDCRELARLVLDEGKDHDRRTDRQNRQNVSRNYFRAEARAKNGRKQLTETTDGTN